MTVRAGVASVVFNDGKLLMLQRKGSHGSGTWSVPGGWMEYGETPYTSAERELLEETGLVATATSILAVTSAVFPAERVHSVCLWVQCSFSEPEHTHQVPRILEPEKCSALEWVLFTEFKDYTPWFEHFRLFYEEYLT
jgi:8-oxo-dGTP diphosphatase